MRELKETFEKHKKSLNEKQAIAYENGSPDKNRRYRMLGAKEILESMKKYQIDEKIFLELPFPELLPYLRTQINSDSCGSSCLRAFILLSYGKNIYEKKLWEINDEIRAENRGLDGGFLHVDMARVLNYFAEKNTDASKAFLSKNGNLEQIAWLVGAKKYPIINRPWTEDDTGGSHYELVLGVDDNNAVLFNPANEVPTTGIYQITREEFMNFWKIKEEHRYIALLESPRKNMFEGKFL